MADCPRGNNRDRPQFAQMMLGDKRYRVLIAGIDRLVRAHILRTDRYWKHDSRGDCRGVRRVLGACARYACPGRLVEAGWFVSPAATTCVEEFLLL